MNKNERFAITVISGSLMAALMVIMLTLNLPLRLILILDAMFIVGAIAL